MVYKNKVSVQKQDSKQLKLRQPSCCEKLMQDKILYHFNSSIKFGILYSVISIVQFCCEENIYFATFCLQKIKYENIPKNENTKRVLKKNLLLLFWYKIRFLNDWMTGKSLTRVKAVQQFSFCILHTFYPKDFP